MIAEASSAGVYTGASHRAISSSAAVRFDRRFNDPGPIPLKGVEGNGMN
jgi:hypothetical protein